MCRDWKQTQNAIFKFDKSLLGHNPVLYFQKEFRHYSPGCDKNIQTFQVPVCYAVTCSLFSGADVLWSHVIIGLCHAVINNKTNWSTWLSLLKPADIVICLLFYPSLCIQEEVFLKTGSIEESEQHFLPNNRLEFIGHGLQYERMANSDGCLHVISLCV